MTVFKRLSFILLVTAGILTSTFLPQLKAQSIDNLKTYVKYLSSDELEGREAGTPGNEKAKDFVVGLFKQLGIQPINNSYLQEFSIRTGISWGPKCAVSFNVLIERPGVPKENWKKIEKKWEIMKDWMPLNFSDNGSFTAPLVFAGFGISAPDLKYDDYESIDVKDKIVIVLRNAPHDRIKQKMYAAKKYTDFEAYTADVYKIQNAVSHGAKAVIFLNVQGDSADVFKPDYKPVALPSNGILVIQANRTSITKLFPPSKQLLPLEEKINKDRKPESMELPNSTTTITIDLQDNMVKVSNIVGTLKGTDPELSKEYIVIGAHYDHIGYGDMMTSMAKSKIPQIHNGADDNASGTAGLVELAGMLSKKPLKRSVIFIAFNGEEKGLKGSNFYSENPLLPLDKTVFMLNMDMIGRMTNNKLYVFGSKTSSTLPAIIDSLGKLDSLDAEPTMSALAPSDHAPFMRKSIPSIMLFSGFEADYHKPSDKFEKINFEGMVSIVKYAYNFVNTIGNSKGRLVWTDVPMFKAMDEMTQNSMKKVKFGIIPSFKESPDGMVISGVSEGTPAQKAGLQKDDIITSFGGIKIKTLAEYNAELKKYLPGNKVKVEYIRGGETFSVYVILEEH